MTLKRLIPLGLLVMVLLLASCAAVPGGSSTADPIIPQFTTTTGWWIDTTGKVPSDLMMQLKEESAAAERDGFQIAGVIFNDSASDPLEFCAQVGDVNGVGTKRIDNGLVFCLYLEKKSDSGKSPVIAVATGSGIEAILNDAKVGRMLDKYYVPDRDKGDWQKATLETLKAFHRFVVEPQAEEFRDKPPDYTGLWIFLVILVLIIIADGIFNDFDICKAFLEAALESTHGTGGTGLGGGGGFGGGGASR